MNRNFICSTTLLSLISVTGMQSSAAEDNPTTLSQTAPHRVNSKDIPTEHWIRFGEGPSTKKLPKVAKTDIDGDLNYDGSILGGDPADGGTYEARPPGLVLGSGEMTKMTLNVQPYDLTFDHGLVVGLEVDQINREVSTGEFASEKERQANAGSIRVWKDANRTQLLLDSSDPNKRYVEWSSQFSSGPYNIPQDFPRVIYVEGIKVSPKHTGDLRLLLTCFERGILNKTKKQLADLNEPSIISQISLDHIILTVQSKPHRKEFIHNNLEGVWISPAQ